MKKGIVGVMFYLLVLVCLGQGNVTSVLIYLVAAYWTFILFIWYHTIAVFHLVLDHFIGHLICDTAAIFMLGQTNSDVFRFGIEWSYYWV